MKIEFLDGSKKELEKGLSAFEIANQISSNLAKKSVCALVNGEMYDLNRPINEDAKLELITKDDKRSLEVLNHSCSHLMASAIKKLYPDSMFGVGPAIEEGFYYDINPGEGIKFSEADLLKIEKEMKHIVSQNVKFERKEVSKKEALELFKNDKYKQEIISELEDDAVITTYTHGDFTDLCRGPHVPSTIMLKNFKLLSIAGAYWRGDSKNEQLQRIYGTCFATEEELNKYLEILEERKKRDHRKLGKELELFMLSDYGPGLPFWLPKGYTLRRLLENFWLDLHKKKGYTTISTPIMLNRELWETSGHWDHYKEDMFTIEVEDGTYAIKPMNCPGAILVYKNDLHSYRELPLRYSELGHVHRYEASGALNGLFRVRGFTQDDAHILLREDQIGAEVARILEIYDYIYSIFNLDYSIELSTRPFDNFIGEISVWDEAEEALKKACLATGHEFKINPGDGAFYGPKLDFKLRDSMNRIWQCGTVQLDMQLPGRFDCTYISEDGTKKTPVMIHRACFGSLERFIGIITENYAGAFPTWLAPVQVKLIPVSLEVHMDFVKKVGQLLEENGIRYEIDDREEKLGYKIREAQTKKIPYQLVCGDNEVNSNLLTYRRYGSEEKITVSIDEFIDMIKKEIKSLGKKDD